MQAIRNVGKYVRYIAYAVVAQAITSFAWIAITYSAAQKKLSYISQLSNVTDFQSNYRSETEASTSICILISVVCFGVIINCLRKIADELEYM